MRPSHETRQALLDSGRESFDALNIVDAFYQKDNPKVSDSVYSPYWGVMVCILAERVVEAELRLEQVKAMLNTTKRKRSKKSPPARKETE